MGLSMLTLIAAKKYVKESLLGGGAVVGKNVVISSITPIDGGNEITFSYTLDSGQVKYSTLRVMDGEPGRDGSDGQKGKDGRDGFSPIVTTSLTNNDTDFRIIIKDANGTTTSPNLMPSTPTIDTSNFITDIEIVNNNLIATKGDGSKKILPLPVVNPGGNPTDVKVSTIVFNNNDEIEITYEGAAIEDFPDFNIDYLTGEVSVLNNGNYNITFNVNNNNELEVNY